MASVNVAGAGYVEAKPGGGEALNGEYGSGVWVSEMAVMGEVEETRRDMRRRRASCWVESSMYFSRPGSCWSGVSWDVPKSVM